MAASPWTEDRGKVHPPPPHRKTVRLYRESEEKSAEPRKCKDHRLQHNEKAHGRHQYQQRAISISAYFSISFSLPSVRIFRSLQHHLSLNTGSLVSFSSSSRPLMTNALNGRSPRRLFISKPVHRSFFLFVFFSPSSNACEQLAKLHPNNKRSKMLGQMNDG